MAFLIMEAVAITVAIVVLILLGSRYILVSVGVVLGILLANFWVGLIAGILVFGLYDSKEINGLNKENDE